MRRLTIIVSFKVTTLARLPKIVLVIHHYVIPGETEEFYRFVSVSLFF